MPRPSLRHDAPARDGRTSTRTASRVASTGRCRAGATIAAEAGSAAGAATRARGATAGAAASAAAPAAGPPLTAAAGWRVRRLPEPRRRPGPLHRDAAVAWRPRCRWSPAPAVMMGCGRIAKGSAWGGVAGPRGRRTQRVHLARAARGPNRTSRYAAPARRSGIGGVSELMPGADGSPLPDRRPLGETQTPGSSPASEGGGRLEVRPWKKGSSSAMAPSCRGAAPRRCSESPRETCFARIER